MTKKYDIDELTVGQKVRVRDWDDMVEEFGTDSNGIYKHIRNTFFVEGMRNYCGQLATVVEMVSGRGCVLDISGCVFDAQTLQPYDDAEIDEHQFVELEITFDDVMMFNI